MIISLKDSMNKSFVKALDFDYEVTTLDGEDISFVAPVHVTGNLKANRGSLDLDIRIDTRLKNVCSRCLAEFERDLSMDVRERMASEVAEDDYDTIQLSEGDDVDLTDILTKYIISSLPIQTLCGEACKGLCQECGANLNEEACDCDRQQVDMRLEALKDLLEEV